MIRNHANGGIQNSGFSESSYNEGIPEGAVRIDVQSDIGAGETTPGIPGTNYGVGSARSKPSNDQQAIDNMGCVNSFVAQQ